MQISDVPAQAQNKLQQANLVVNPAGGSKQRIPLNSADSTFQYIRDKHVGAIGGWLNEQARNFHTGYKGSKVSCDNPTGSAPLHCLSTGAQSTVKAAILLMESLLLPIGELASLLPRDLDVTILSTSCCYSVPPSV